MSRWGVPGVCFDFRAVRGPKTRQAFLNFGCNIPEVYGDPALLMPYLYDPRVSTMPDIDLCIIPHMDDLVDEFEWWKRNNGTSLLRRFSYFDHRMFSDGPTSNKSISIRLIDIRTPDVAAFVNTLTTCRLVASASLHGLILAEAYNITWSWVQLRNKNEGAFKYHDFFLSVGIKPEDAKVSKQKSYEYVHLFARSSCILPFCEHPCSHFV
jgi:pyruvyltransferase